MLIEDGTLYYRKSGRTQKVVTTKEERDSILEISHVGVMEDQTGSHTGNKAVSAVTEPRRHADSAAMLAEIEPQYKWLDMKLDIDDWVCVCMHYLVSKKRK